MSYIFLSHCAQDHGTALRLGGQLLSSGFDVWSITAADPSMDEPETQSAMRRAGIFLALCSTMGQLDDGLARQLQYAELKKKNILIGLLEGELGSDYSRHMNIDLRHSSTLSSRLLMLLEGSVQRGVFGGQIIASLEHLPPEVEEEEPSDFNSPTTALGRPKELQDLSKAMRSGLFGNSRKGKD